jgi:hypothetical protein
MRSDPMVLKRLRFLSSRLHRRAQVPAIREPASGDRPATCSIRFAEAMNPQLISGVVGKLEMEGSRARVIVCLVILLATSTVTGHEVVFAGAASSQGRVLEVSVDSGRLTVRVREAPLAEVLEAVGRQAGVTIALRGNLDALVTETLVDVPVDEGIRRLTRWQSVVLVYAEPADGREYVELTEVWVAAAASGPRENGVRAPGVRSDDLRGDTPPSVDRSRLGAREQGSNAVSDRRQLATTDPSPTVRQRVLQNLARQPGVDAVKELREAAIRDPEPLVRQAAIRALARIKSAEAGDALRLMLSDSDPNIRELASHVLARWQHRIR